MRGETILEVGSGAGRFTEPAASTGALVVSVDLSAAVEANYSSNGDRANVLIAQSSIYELPLRRDSFDRVLCIGVLQHTPDVKRAFLALPQHLKPGGSLVVDFYRHYGFWLELLRTRRWVRPWTKRMRPASLYAACRRYVNFMWPFARRITALPFGRRINRALLVADYSGLYGLDDDVLREWAILDTFD
ncbi:MAG TPA: class I SAM-dependent methyltransferase, partial [Planctomycetota bacterium]|nr:class I SAM-dependent methyltransferase [Planctomycetota bacterium]